MLKVKDVNDVISTYIVLEDSYSTDFMPKVLGHKRRQGFYKKSGGWSDEDKYKNTPPWFERVIQRITHYNNYIYIIVKKEDKNGN